MNIIGLDALVFGVTDVDACSRYLLDYGLEPGATSGGAVHFAALDGTGVVVAHESDATLPPRLATGSQLRETVYGVQDHATLEDIARELGRDRELRWGGDGVLHATDDLGFALAFQVSRRRPLDLAAEAVNAPGSPARRGVNCVGVDAASRCSPRTLSHVVYFVPDAAKAEEFYTKRLGFVCTDRFARVGPFLRPRGTLDHHTLFMIQTPPHLQGVEHFTFHLGGPTEVLLAGTRLVERGHTSFWGPGRHVLGSNWFWYFDSPFGCHVEYDADMDLHDDSWSPRSVGLSTDNSQLFLFAHRAKWAPGGA